MATIINKNFFWQIWSGGNLDDPSCIMIEYDTWSDGKKNQRTLDGEEKEAAIYQVNTDRAKEEPGGSYKQTTVSASKKIYMRTGKMSGNSWEVKFDDNGIIMADPCPTDGSMPNGNDDSEPNTDLEKGVVKIINATTTLALSGNKVTMTTTGDIA